MVYMLWRECIPAEFYKYICNEQNFIYLNGKDIKQAGVLEIVGNFINQGKEQLRILQEYLSRYKDIYQYVYSHVFPDIYTNSEKRDFNLKSNFHTLFKAYRNKQLIRQHATAKNPINYEQKNETFENEQKSIFNFDQFSDKEEREIKIRAKKRLNKRRKKAEELKEKNEK